MARKYLLRSFEEIIENQLKGRNPESTYKTYQILLEKGFDEERVIQKLMYHIENLIYDSLAEEKEFDVESWNQKMEELAKEEYIDELLSDYQLKKMISRCKKEFGTIKNSEENLYQEGLYAIEKNLYTLHQRYQLMGRDLLQIVELVIAMMYSFYHHEVYNYEEIASEDLIYMSKVVEFHLNAYENEELREEFLKDNDVNMNDHEIRYRIFAMSLRCLMRVKESIEFWTKEAGIEGYIRYISNFMES